MLFLLCFLYCFFAIILGLYLGLELISVRKAERMARTIIKAAQAAQAGAAEAAKEIGPAPKAEANYFTSK